MTKDEIIKQLILSNLQKSWDDEDVKYFTLQWKWTNISYNAQKNKDKSLAEMIDWFYEKIMELSKND